MCIKRLGILILLTAGQNLWLTLICNCLISFSASGGVEWWRWFCVEGNDSNSLPSTSTRHPGRFWNWFSPVIVIFPHLKCSPSCKGVLVFDFCLLDDYTMLSCGMEMELNLTQIVRTDIIWTLFHTNFWILVWNGEPSIWLNWFSLGMIWSFLSEEQPNLWGLLGCMKHECMTIILGVGYGFGEGLSIMYAFA